MTNGNQQNSSEQRNYFRVRDDVLLQHRQVDKSKLAAGAPETLFPELAGVQGFSEFRKLGEELTAQLSGLDGSIAAALKILDRRLELLGQKLFSQSAGATSSPVSLSEGGIAFLADKAPYAGSYLALAITFTRTGLTLFCFAEVLRTEEKGKQFQIAARFRQLSSSDKALVARQVMTRQRKKDEREEE